MTIDNQDALNFRDSDRGKGPEAVARVAPRHETHPAQPLSVPRPTNRGTGNCTVLRYGVDSLYLSYTGELRNEWISALESARECAQSPDELTQAKAQVSILDHRFEVSSSGSKLYRYHLSDAAYSIQLSRRRKSKVPAAYVQLRSQWLTSVGVDQAVAQLGSILRAMVSLDGEPNVSRVDLFVDFMSPTVLDSWTREAWVTRARTLAAYVVDNQFSGWTIGLGGALSARLYDKTIEIQKSKKDFLKVLWAAKGWTPDKRVYRLEFQFRSEALKELGLRSYGGLAEGAGGIWRYAATDWLRLTVPNPEDATKARWQTHPLWLDLAELPWSGFEVGSRAPLRSDRAPAPESIYRLFEAAVTSYMAVQALVDPAAAADRLLTEAIQHVTRHMEITGETFEARMYARASRKAKQFNLPYPGEMFIDEASVKEADRLAYLRATGRD